MLNFDNLFLTTNTFLGDFISKHNAIIYGFIQTNCHFWLLYEEKFLQFDLDVDSPF